MVMASLHRPLHLLKSQNQEHQYREHVFGRIGGRNKKGVCTRCRAAFDIIPSSASLLPQCLPLFPPPSLHSVFSQLSVDISFVWASTCFNVSLCFSSNWDFHGIPLDLQINLRRCLVSFIHANHSGLTRHISSAKTRKVSCYAFSSSEAVRLWDFSV